MKSHLQKLLALTALLAVLPFVGWNGNAQENGPRFDKTPAAKRVLQNRPLTPLDRSSFSPAIYPETPPLVPAQGPPPTEMQVVMMLRDYLATEWTHDRKSQQAGLALFNNPLLKAKVPNPSLRAAVVALDGTIAADAIDFILNAKTEDGLPKVIAIGFGVPEEWQNDPGVARVFVQTNGQMVMVFNPRYESENPFLHTQFIAHEVLHSDSEVAGLEEVALLALQSFVYLQQLSRHPELGALRTELARRSNSNAFARLNAGQGSSLGNLTNDNRPLLPGSPLVSTSWFDQFDQLPNLVPTPGNELLADYLGRLQEKNKNSCSAAEFNLALVFCVLENQNALNAKELVRAANALGLNTRLKIQAKEIGN